MALGGAADDTGTPSRAWVPPLAVALFAAATWAFVGWGTPPGCPLDDAWIHQVVARTFALTGFMGFAPGASTGGSTSILWTDLLAPAHLAGAADPVILTRGLSLLLWVGTLEPSYALSRADGWGGLPSAAIAVGATLCGNAVWFAWTGMEATLFVALSVFSVAAWRMHRQLWLDVALAALALTRPEGAGLGIVLAAFEPTWPEAACSGDPVRRRARARRMVLAPDRNVAHGGVGVALGPTQHAWAGQVLHAVSK